MNIIISTFYYFTDLSQLKQSLQQELLKLCIKENIKGTILIADEGVNATVSGHRANIDNLYTYFSNQACLKDIHFKESQTNFHPFGKTKVKLRKEIVTMGVDGLEVNELKGDYIEPQDWDSFIKNEDVLVIDTRNKYEIALGKFHNAVDPQTNNFRDFPTWVQHNLDRLKNSKKVAMYCTGGVRCEKSTAYLRKLGIEEVYHLKGGIVNYFEITENRNDSWEGECFTFDDRVAIDNYLKPIAKEKITCIKCNQAITTDDLKLIQGNKHDNKCYSCIVS